MKANFVYFAMAALFCGGASAQALTEHVAGAAGATIGAGGGKVLSNTIDKTLNQARDIGSDAAGAMQVNDKPTTAAQKPASAPVTILPQTQGVARIPQRRQRMAPASGKPVFAAATIAARAPMMASPPPSPEDFAKVKEGGERQQVFTALGTPSSHVTIPDEGHLIEILSWSDGNRRVGSIRLDNGHVVSVTALAR